jgi:phosphoribosylformylglycinamidine cyclo-ligase
MKLPLDATLPGLGAPLAEALMRPTRIYVKAIRALEKADLLHGAAHITGGGLIDNPTRMLPPGAKLKLHVRLGSWEIPTLFEQLARGGNVAPEEMLRTFNMGIGMIVCVPKARAGDARALLEAQGERVFDIGEVADSSVVDGPVEFSGRLPVATRPTDPA